MKILLGVAAATSIALTAGANAVTVKSGSKYPIAVSVFSFKEDCKKKGLDVANSLTSAKKAFEKGGLFAALKESVVGAVEGSGCERVGQDVMLMSSGDDVNLPAGSLIVAFKDPVMAKAKHNKIVNPFPAITKVPASGTVVLETRKLSKGILGIKGDGGLKATNK